ncbi:dihydrofolate reductase family protein [Flaviaesturariibacter aridisoli]|uniref:Dihydrofolate reductase n=1 Tax=Flaviaesturariibacter aridisoli TaxID=2545761 RepID=A0A4R4DWY3_9BACT|nr:dihydrofolate reductase family protein [Flaviaesturariibacter aridisoli]TCZ67478.1 dihydrofolate reductase [Flaviaesturariibacter aridisoli]
MRKVIAAINMTLDGFCDHSAVDPDEEIHQHYSNLLTDAGVLLYGRITYQLMEYWRTVLAQPTGQRALDEFAQAIDNVPKLVFSRTLHEVDWDSARLATRGLEEEVLALRQQAGKDIFVGSPGLIVALTRLGLIDQYQICVHPVIAGGGLPLFHQLDKRIALNRTATKSFSSGAIILYYEPVASRPRRRMASDAGC